MSENKVIIEAKLIPLTNAQKKEYASRIPLVNENPQVDLMLMSAVLVSTGTNKNGATFMGSELIMAKDSIIDKALDIEHKQDKVIGHIKSCVYLDQQGNILDVDRLHSQLETASTGDERSKVIAALDSTDMDIGIVCVVHKHRFPEEAEDIKKGEWHVSMECYYEDFDLKIGDIIIPKDQASKMDFDFRTNSLVKLIVSGHSLGNHKVSRVLRGIKFCGVGIVKHPANVRSIVDETAGRTVQVNDDINEIMVGYREAANVIGTVDIKDSSNLKHTHFLEDEEKEVKLENIENMYSIVAVQKVSEKGSFVCAIGKDNEDRDVVSYTGQMSNALYSKTHELALQSAVKATRITGVEHEVISHTNHTSINNSEMFSEEELDSGFALLKTNKHGDIKSMIETSNFAFVGGSRGGSRWGAGDNAAGICVDFAKYHYEFDRSPNPGRLMGVHWCKLFDQPCPVLGADPTARECLRHKYSRLIKDDSIHFNAVREEKWNPKSTLADGEDIVFLPAESQPSPPEGSGDPAINERYGERFIQGPAEFDDSFEKPSINEVTFDDGHPNSKSVNAPSDEDLSVTERVTKHDPGLEEFKSLLSDAASKVDKVFKKVFLIEELSNLNDSDFAFPERRELPIHTPEAVYQAMEIVAKKITAERLKENGDPTKYLYPHARIMRKAFILEVDTRNFEYILPYEESKEGPNFGIPRLKLFPLDSRQSVIAAISRFDKIKQDITEEEKNILFVKIVKAASSFGVNVEKFVSRFRNIE